MVTLTPVIFQRMVKWTCRLCRIARFHSPGEASPSSAETRKGSKIQKVADATYLFYMYSPAFSSQLKHPYCISLEK